HSCPPPTPLRSSPLPFLFSFSLLRSRVLRYLPSFPTRRSSDLIISTIFPLGNYFLQKYIILIDRNVSQQGIITIVKTLPLFTIITNIQCRWRSEEHTSELQSRFDLVCRLLLEKKNRSIYSTFVETDNLI